jgi:hypothetical protein
MPERARRPRRRLGSNAADFTCEREVRAAVAEVRAAHATVDAAEASEAWRALRPRVARWILRTALGLPVVGKEEHALRIAHVYLRRPEFLPPIRPRTGSD